MTNNAILYSYYPVYNSPCDLKRIALFHNAVAYICSPIDHLDYHIQAFDICAHVIEESIAFESISPSLDRFVFGRTYSNLVGSLAHLENHKNIF